MKRVDWHCAGIKIDHNTAEQATNNKAQLEARNKELDHCERCGFGAPKGSAGDFKQHQSGVDVA